MNSLETPDLTTEEAFALLRAADKDSRFSHSVHRQEMRFHHDAYAAPGLQYTVMATATGEQHAAQTKPTLRAAVDEVIEKMNQPASVKAALLRAQAAQIIAKAEQLEAAKLHA